MSQGAQHLECEPRESLRIAVAMIAIGVWTIVLASCNTARGVGQDLQEVGDAIEDSAEDAAE